nr:unnamed protein product [Callosobruchus analis]
MSTVKSRQNVFASDFGGESEKTEANSTFTYTNRRDNRVRVNCGEVLGLKRFEEKGLEHLSKFMGHTLRTHCNIYRLSDDLYQTEKISKLLLLMMDGGIGQFKVKRPDQIDIIVEEIMMYAYELRLSFNSPIAKLPFS